MININPKSLILILLFLIGIVLLFSFLLFFMTIKPGKWPIYSTPEQFKINYENVSFKSSDGLVLSGWFLPSNKSNTTIIVMHGYPTNKADVLPASLFLLEDFNVFLFDFRGFGDSNGKFTTAGFNEVKDLDGAIKYLKSRKDTKNIGALGFSLGASVAIMNRNNNIKAIVSDSAYSNLNNMVEIMYKNFYIFKKPFIYMTKIYSKIFFGVDILNISPENSIKTIKKPVLLIHGEIDRQIPVSEAYSLHNANKKTELWIVKNADHIQSHSLYEKEYEKRVLDFFRKNLK